MADDFPQNRSCSGVPAPLVTDSTEMRSEIPVAASFRSLCLLQKKNGEYREKMTVRLQKGAFFVPSQAARVLFTGGQDPLDKRKLPYYD